MTGSCVQIPCGRWSLIPTLSISSRKCNSRELLVLFEGIEGYFFDATYVNSFPGIVNVKIAMSN